MNAKMKIYFDNIWKNKNMIWNEQNYDARLYQN
jgi:hypothetical protein